MRFHKFTSWITFLHIECTEATKASLQEVAFFNSFPSQKPLVHIHSCTRGELPGFGLPNDKFEYRRKNKWIRSKQYTSIEFIFYFQQQAINHMEIIDDF